MANNELKRALDEATTILTTATTKLERGSENTSDSISENLRYDSYIGVWLKQIVSGNFSKRETY